MMVYPPSITIGRPYVCISFSDGRKSEPIFLGYLQMQTPCKPTYNWLQRTILRAIDRLHKALELTPKDIDRIGVKRVYRGRLFPYSYSDNTCNFIYCSALAALQFVKMHINIHEAEMAFKKLSKGNDVK